MTTLNNQMTTNNPQNYQFFIGIDPGLTGAVAILDTHGELKAVHDLPTTAQGGFIKKRINAVILTTLLQPYSHSSLAAIEIVGYRAGQGALSGASLASSMAYCEGVLAGLGVDTLRLPPAIWKKAMGLTGSGKQGSIERARALFNVSLRHDQAEAVLLARFAWLNRDKGLPEIALPEVVTEAATQETATDRTERHQNSQKRKVNTGARAKEKTRQNALDDDLGAFVVDEQV